MAPQGGHVLVVACDEEREHRVAHEREGRPHQTSLRQHTEAHTCPGAGACIFDGCWEE